jgi:hypothetical protein
MPMAIFMKAIGSMIKQRALEHTVMQMEPFIKELGLTINSTAKELKIGLMERDITACITKEKNRAMVV